MTSSNLFEQHLLQSMQHGFIDRNHFTDGGYAPKILINQKEPPRFVLTDLQNELSKSQGFDFSIAFVTQSGIALIKSQLSDLHDQGIHGRILISPYLDFNDPDAMRELLKIPNIQVRLTPPEMNMHAKFYLFKQAHKDVLITGSSNLTGNALKTNYEWNIKLTSTHNGQLLQQSQEEFNRLWEQSQELTEDTIARYSKTRKPVIRQEVSEPVSYLLPSIRPNAMQKEALKGLRDVREKGKRRALIISATGTGKTILSAFDVQQFNPRRMLFLVHREQILAKSMQDYQKVLGCDPDEIGHYKAGHPLSKKVRYVFATIQTLSRENHLHSFDQEAFDYILIDEVHKAAADTYQTVINYFRPSFLLGMTATPERTDGQNIYELFNYNIAYEIRLQDALDNDMLCPFIYYGIADMRIDGQLVDENTSFSQLVSERRVQHLLEKINYYGTTGQTVKGLIFCSSNKEASALEEALNQYGLRTKALSGKSSPEERKQAVKDLEGGYLDYLLTVDIFNEGIDIPQVNQVIMLRNTQSSIVFVQQLGRGLRKHKSKEFVTVLDFIGNYKNNYLIPIALFGDQSLNKDNYRREIQEPNLINGLTTINFEEIAKEQIFKSITNTTLSSMTLLREAYQDLENKLGRPPLMQDYVHHKSIDPLVFFQNSSFKNYYDVLNKFADHEQLQSLLVETRLDANQERWITFLTFELLSGKRSHELLLLSLLLEHGEVGHDVWIASLIARGASTDQATIDSALRVLDLSFLKQTEWTRFGPEPLVTFSQKTKTYHLNADFQQSLNNDMFSVLVYDLVDTGLALSEKFPSVFTLGQKYTRREIVKLLNWEKDTNPQNIGGYKIDTTTMTCPIFITYHKSDEISPTIQYEDELLNEQTLRYFSKNKRTLTSPDVSKMIQSSEIGLRMELFIKKDDNEQADFYYMGPLEYIEDSAIQTTKAGQNIVRMDFRLQEPVPDSLYRYLTSK